MYGQQALFDFPVEGDEVEETLSRTLAISLGQERVDGEVVIDGFSFAFSFAFSTRPTKSPRNSQVIAAICFCDVVLD